MYKIDEVQQKSVMTANKNYQKWNLSSGTLSNGKECVGHHIAINVEWNAIECKGLERYMALLLNSTARCLSRNLENVLFVLGGQKRFLLTTVIALGKTGRYYALTATHLLDKLKIVPRYYFQQLGILKNTLSRYGSWAAAVRHHDLHNWY